MMNKYEKGKLGEKIAIVFLEGLGYDILETNFNNAYGEIDIVAFKDNAYVFVEVKFRRTNCMGTPAEAVTKKKQQRIINGTLFYLSEKNLNDAQCRFDVIEVTEKAGEYAVNHIENAFMA